MEELKTEIEQLKSAIAQQAEINNRQSKILLGVIAVIITYTIAADRVEEFNKQYGQAVQMVGAIAGVGFGIRGLKDQ